MINKTSSTSTEPIVMILLSGGYSATKTFYDKVRLQVAEAVNYYSECEHLNGSETFTVEGLCEKHFWNQSGSEEHKLAGRCVVNMVNADQLSLTHAGRNGQNSRLYKLK